ncbi:hypothetical protein ANANG_G00156560 [Anguilla anguilla]|uniref:Nuclear cap-binding protein subunit 3 n=1 Tax=Anguilla anguilla TaxID=7936 RepID=A0A9D3RUV4_ANGAN|nr:hypothetical protein ANANG_G00156560 [Anguilla anguilla]
MDYDLELKMISTPSPKKSMKMTMYADEVESNLKTLRNSVRGEGGSSSGVRNRIGSGGGGGGGTKTAAVEKVTDVRQLLEEKRQGLAQQQRSPQPYMNATARTDVRKRLGKRPHSPESRRSTSPAPKEKKTGGLWSRLGSSQMDKVPEKKADSKGVGGAKGSKAGPEEDDSELQKVWGAMIKEKEQQSHKMKKSRLDNLPSLQIEISRDSSNGSDSDS